MADNTCCNAFNLALACSDVPYRVNDQTGADIYARCCDNIPNDSRSDRNPLVAHPQAEALTDGA